MQGLSQSHTTYFRAPAVGVVGSILGSQDVLAAGLLFLGSAVLAPAAEEIAYRGFLLPSMQRTLPAPAAVSGGQSMRTLAACTFEHYILQICSPAAVPRLPQVAAVAAIFAAAHLQPDGLLQLAVVGMCLGTAAVVSGGNLAAPTAGHMLYNAALFFSLLVT